ncbi:hypothetical protein A4D02_13380 [Niastella koreensis]|uniref:Lipoprotein n=2 Tax=Niastella koreensis TaxID=354356 RepID=G8TNL7_NIAKG|nr:hypothetical protein [Niastella koreensis]AEW00943.1 hypothetical protein Niako_4687 [Niastella koreensis GR20-10]OQP42552.1 hypothetical protein A4D02_13380 [Niastella koreensis]
MPKSLPLAVIPFLFCVSCASTTYQYATITSPDMVKNDRREFVVENDSLRLTYNFSGKGGLIHISIQNKMGVPVYIDWQRSAIIANDKARPYAAQEMKVEGNFQSNTYNYRNIGQVQATAVLPQTIEFIPPRAVSNKSPMYYLSGFNSRIPDTAFHQLKYPVTDGVTVKVKKATFTETTSPFSFRSFITYMVGEPGTKPIALEHSFYISEIMNTGSGPVEMAVNKSNRGDQYYSIRY